MRDTRPTVVNQDVGIDQVIVSDREGLDLFVRPVCLVACEYARWADIVRGFIEELSADEQNRILGITAAKAYNL